MIMGMFYVSGGEMLPLFFNPILILKVDLLVVL